jgi:hypothetical protein
VGGAAVRAPVIIAALREYSRRWERATPSAQRLRNPATG